MSRIRRDPRAERSARLLGSGPRPRYALAAAPAGRRRDPRAERAALTVPGTPRPRLDRSGQLFATVREAAAAQPLRPLVIDDPAFLVAVVAEAPLGRLGPHDRQLLGGGQALSGGGGAVVLIAPPLEDGPGPAGADRLVTLAAAGGYEPERRAAQVAAQIRALAPRHVLFAETADGGDLARRVAAALGEPLFAGAESLSASRAVRKARAGRVEQHRAPPRLISVEADRVAPYRGPAREAKAVAAVAAEPRPGGIEDAVAVPADPAAVSLAEAGFVLSAGNGVADFAMFRALAAALAATPGGSRMVCDAGLMPRAAQVGASGSVLTADCYFALGISGAPQHLQGIAGVEHVLAVNTDLHAAMIERAELSIIADAQAVMPALLKALAERVS